MTPAREAQNPAKPAGLHPLGQPDARFSVSFESSVPEAMRLLSEYFVALSRRDLEGMARTLHFPFASVEGTEPVVIESLEQLHGQPPKSR